MSNEQSVKRQKTSGPSKLEQCQNRLAEIADRHDDKVRLLFHLDKFVSLVNYDPKVAKEDKSDVFEQYRQLHDLWDQTAADAGRGRHTRRQLKAMAGSVKENEETPVKVPQPESTVPQKSRHRAGVNGVIPKSVGTTAAPSKTTKTTSKHVAPKTNGKANAPTLSKTVSKKSSTVNARPKRGGRRTKSASVPVKEEEEDSDVSAHALHGSSSDEDDLLSEPEGGYDFSALDQIPIYDSWKNVKKLRLKVNVPEGIVTNPSQLVKPSFDGNLDKFLDSFVLLDDELTKEQLEEYISEQRQLRRRIREATESGVLSRVEERSGLADKFVDPETTRTHQDYLNMHACQFAKLMAEERRFHLSRAKKVAGMIDFHFKRLSTADEREKKQTERMLKQLARKTAQDVLKKWKLAEKVVIQRQKLKHEEEMREKGKKHLSHILEQSAQLLEARFEESEPDDEEVEGSGGEVGSESEQSDEDSLSESSDSEEEEDDVAAEDEDDKLSLEELRRKYAELPDIEEEPEADSDDEDVEMHDEESAVEEVELAKPSEEALKLYQDIQSSDNADSDDDSDSLDSESESEEESDGEEEEVSEEEAPGLSLAALYGAQADEEDDDDDVNMSDRISEASFEKQPDESDEEEPGDMGANMITPTSDEEGNAAVPFHKADSEVVKMKHIDPPFLLRGTLREYQNTGLDWLAGLYNTHTNGILADEMGLGKTIQTISLLAYLACEKHVWGPHLIIVPTSVMLNWEMEFKRFAPGFKVLTYYGNPQQRKDKRRGWNKPDTWHVCITSYQLVIQDQAAFKRKRWQYMILDEAHNIKNFRSQRWQALLNFNSERRLLLTGTPLQNNLIELWSLLYFLMPSQNFATLQDFQDWFARPVDKLVEEGGDTNDAETRNTVTKLHQVLRPYLLRRLKADVEKQMPGKYEHVIYCRLSKRQRYLYDDFMARAQTRETLASGNFLSIINCLMQLRKVCNHPDLFEVRPIVTSFAIQKSVPSSFKSTLDALMHIDREDVFANKSDTLNLGLCQTEPMSTMVWRDCMALRGTQGLLSLIEEPGEVVEPNYYSISENLKYLQYMRSKDKMNRLLHHATLNEQRLSKAPMYGSDLLSRLESMTTKLTTHSFTWDVSDCIKGLVLGYDDRAAQMKDVLIRFSCVTPPVVYLNAARLTLGDEIYTRLKYPEFTSQEIEAVQLPRPHANRPFSLINYIKEDWTAELPPSEDEAYRLKQDDTFHEAQTRLSIAFPDKRLLQYDCGKLQRLSILLRDLIDGGHRALIFTQMTKMLDILEQFLNIHGWRYLRLDGATRIEQRQVLTERFNADSRIPVFILSTRSGGLGINLTGADTVIFYDSDWNPSMDKQCQDRCHRIGQTRDVHIYRLVSEFTIESNILRKATQKQILDNVVIQEGDFTTDYFERLSVKDLVGDIGSEQSLMSVGNMKESNFTKALGMAEDADDATAAKMAMTEVNVDANDFSEKAPIVAQEGDDEQPSTREQSIAPEYKSETPGVERTEDSDYPREQSEPPFGTENGEMEDEDEEEEEVGGIDDYMIRFIENGYFY